MELIELKHSSHLDDFASRQERASFNQSWAWGTIEQADGKQVWRLGVTENGRLVGVAQLVQYTLPFGFSFLYCARGPVLAEELGEAEKREAMATVLGGARRIAERTPRAEIAVRLEPALPPSYAGALRSLRTIPATSIQPSVTQLIDLSLEESQILAAMHPKTRYNIGLAQRHGITAWREENHSRGLATFARLMEHTAARHNFKAHTLGHYHSILRHCDGQGGNPLAELWTAGQDNEPPLAAAMTVAWGDTVTYLHGASDPAFKHLMAPHALQWQMIRNALAQGFGSYDLWGIAPANQLNHPWAGFTRFKQGFGGRPVEYVGAWDFVQQPGWYHLYQIYRRLRGKP